MRKLLWWKLSNAYTDRKQIVHLLINTFQAGQYISSGTRKAEQKIFDIKNTTLFIFILKYLLRSKPGTAEIIEV